MSSGSATVRAKSVPPRQPITKAYPFWFGGAAAGVAATVSHPFDLIKVRLQTTNAQRDSAIKTFKNIIRLEGPRGLYKGLSASLLRQGTYSTTRFGVYDKFKYALSKDREKLSFFESLLCAAVAGSFGGACGNPADVVMVRMQNDAKRPPNERYNYKHAIDGLIRIQREETFRGLFRGIGPNINRAILMSASQLATYDKFKELLLGTGLFKDNYITHFGASLLAGLVATTVCSPLDVVKTRVMSDAGSTKGVAASLVLIIQKEGPAALFKGWLPAFTRLTPHTIVTFMVLEQFRNVYDHIILGVKTIH
ncbi:6535_t:CDS:2 [Paraglomus occultum]|uniref:6535_t:CDS:1 n=1 Tax=Paraglomus occultum TaxID=144539 RepID=A0A9N9F851_9GLOM|nr:6535_t:CDS:2 [Paraglomus occultum]